MKEINSEKICKSLEKIWFKRYHSPLRLLSDNGRQFISHNFERFLEKYQISQVTSAPYNPTSNGIVERINKEIGIVLRLSKGSSLKILKTNFLKRHNLTAKRNIGYPLFEIFFEKSIFKNY